MYVSSARTVSHDYLSCKGAWERGYVAQTRHIFAMIKTVLSLVKEKRVEASRACPASLIERSRGHRRASWAEQQPHSTCRQYLLSVQIMTRCLYEEAESERVVSQCVPEIFLQHSTANSAYLFYY